MNFKLPGRVSVSAVALIIRYREVKLRYFSVRFVVKLAKNRYLCAHKNSEHKPSVMIELTENQSLLPHNTFGMDVHTAWLAEYDSVDDLIELLQRPAVAGRPLLHIGQGSNLLFTGDYPGVVLHSRIRSIHIVSEEGDLVTVEAGSGTVWDELCAWTVERGLSGLENLSGIPGECGAAAVQNIGAYGAEIADILSEVEVVEVANGRQRTLSQSECRYGYRDSLFKSEEHRGKYIITTIRVTLHRTPQVNLKYKHLADALKEIAHPTPADVRRAVLALRDSKLPDPKQVGNAGSFFKNPVVAHSVTEKLLNVYPFMPVHAVDTRHDKLSAGWLIEQCGWKGRNLGRAGVYERQSLVLVNRGHATPDEVIQLSEAIIRTVNDRYGIRLEPEVNFI